MEASNRKRLKKNYCLMVDNIVFTEVQDLLYERDVIDDEELELIGSKPTKKGQIRELIKILIGKEEKNAFEDFCKVLRDCQADYGYISDELLGTEVTDDDEDFVDGGKQSAEEKVAEMMKHVWSQTQMMLEMQQQHRLEIEELRRQLNARTPVDGPKLRSRMVGYPKGSEVGVQMDTVDGNQFVQTYMVDFIKKPWSDNGSQWPRCMSRFRPKSLDEIEKIACHLGIDVMQFFLNLAGHKLDLRPADTYTETMRRMTKAVLDQHGEELEKCVEAMDKVEMDGYLAIDRLADELFEDGKKINWGRIVVWYAFWGRCVTSLPLKDDNIRDSVKFYGNFVGFYLARRLHHWIAQQGGWGAFVQTYISDRVDMPVSILRGRRLLIVLLFTVIRGFTEIYPTSYNF